MSLHDSLRDSLPDCLYFCSKCTGTAAYFPSSFCVATLLLEGVITPSLVQSESLLSSSPSCLKSHFLDLHTGQLLLSNEQPTVFLKRNSPTWAQDSTQRHHRDSPAEQFHGFEDPICSCPLQQQDLESYSTSPSRSKSIEPVPPPACHWPPSL